MQEQGQPVPIQPIGIAGDYELYTKLGDGGQAVVFAGSKDFQLYAVKIFHPGVTRESAFRQEVEFLRNLTFPHLINLVDFTPNATIRMQNQPIQTRNILVEEIADGFQIFEFIARQGRFPPQICRYYIKQLIQTLKYLVSQNIAHRDIKPENILLDSHFNIKLSDFGLACDSRGEFGDNKLRERVGTQGYRPPQMEDSNYTGYHADLFAIGVVLFIMYKGLPPFLSTRPHDRGYRLIRQNNFTRFWEAHERNLPVNFFTMPFKRLMNAFFSINPNQRHSFQSLEQDEWLNGQTATPQEVFQYMQQKFNLLYSNNRIQEVRKFLLKQKIQQQLKCKEQEKPIIGEQDRYEEDEDLIQSLSIDERFVKTYSLLNINLDDLPEFNKKKVIYLKQNPNFVVSWIKDFMTLSFKENQKFLNDYIEDIEPKQFFFSFDKKKFEIELCLDFSIVEESQTSETQLKLIGKLHKSKTGEVGVEWLKQIGNFYWLSAIQSRINESLQKIK